MILSSKEIIFTFKKKSQEFNKVVKIGRTHLMDATPLTGQVFSDTLHNLITVLKI